MKNVLGQTLVILLAGAGAYLSVSSKLDSNQNASTTLVKTIDQARIAQAAADKEAADKKAQEDKGAADEQTRRILSLLDRQLENMKGVLDSIQQVSTQNQKLNEQVLAQGKELKMIEEGQSKILNEHTGALEEAKSKAQRAVVVAEENQATTQRAIRLLHPPKPKTTPGTNPFQRWFAAPSPTPRR